MILLLFTLQKSIALKHISLYKSLKVKSETSICIKYQCLVVLSLVCGGGRIQPKSEFLHTKAVAFIVVF